jgi:hypothetical protein
VNDLDLRCRSISLVPAGALLTWGNTCLEGSSSLSSTTTNLLFDKTLIYSDKKGKHILYNKTKYLFYFCFVFNGAGDEPALSMSRTCPPIAPIKNTSSSPAALVASVPPS